MQNALAPNLMTENVADAVRYYLCALLWSNDRNKQES